MPQLRGRLQTVQNELKTLTMRITTYQGNFRCKIYKLNLSPYLFQQLKYGRVSRFNIDLTAAIIYNITYHSSVMAVVRRNVEFHTDSVRKSAVFVNCTIRIPATNDGN